MNFIIYVHKNKINGKCYVGVTSTTTQLRWGKQGSKYLGQPKFANAIMKYGWDNFEHIILEETNNENEADILEREYVLKFNSFKNGYNSTTGGYKNFKISEEAKKKISNTMKGVPKPKKLMENLWELRNHYWNNGGIEKQREFAKGNTYGNKKIMVYDTFTETDMIYPSIKTFCEEVGLGHHLVISAKYAQCKAGSRYYIENV
jgi:group I intron endonuclease